AEGCRLVLDPGPRPATGPAFGPVVRARRCDCAEFPRRTCPESPVSRPRPAAALLGGLALLLAACGTTAADDDGADATPSADAAAGFPVTVTSCGTETTLAAPPERIVTIKSSATEMVLALGAGDRLVGTAFADGPLPEGSVEPPVLAERNPSREAVLELAPDLVYAGWESNLSDEG